MPAAQPEWRTRRTTPTQPHDATWLFWFAAQWRIDLLAVVTDRTNLGNSHYVIVRHRPLCYSRHPLCNIVKGASRSKG